MCIIGYNGVRTYKNCSRKPGGYCVGVGRELRNRDLDEDGRREYTLEYGPCHKQEKTNHIVIFIS